LVGLGQQSSHVSNLFSFVVAENATFRESPTFILVRALKRALVQAS
jgi:hypothetical protein